MHRFVPDQDLPSARCYCVHVEAEGGVGVRLTRMVRLQTLEAEPGDMLRDPENVKANAEATVARYHERLQAEQQARDQVISYFCAKRDLLYVKRDLLSVPKETYFMSKEWLSVRFACAAMRRVLQCAACGSALPLARRA